MALQFKIFTMTLGTSPYTFPYKGITAGTLKLRPLGVGTTTSHDIECAEYGAGGANANGVYHAKAGSYPSTPSTKVITVGSDFKIPRLKYEIMLSGASSGFVDCSLKEWEYNYDGVITTTSSKLIPSEGDLYLCGEDGTYTNFLDITGTARVCTQGDALLCIDLGSTLTYKYVWMLLEGYGKATMLA